MESNGLDVAMPYIDCPDEKNASTSSSLLTLPPNPHFCYILRAQNLTYNGYTTDLIRRIKQHNGELIGGAKSTRRSQGMWSYLAVLHSPRWTKQRALQVEWICRYPTGQKPRPVRYSKPLGRVQSLELVCKSVEEPLLVGIHEDYLALALQWNLPQHVELVPLSSLIDAYQLICSKDMKTSSKSPS
eukprot:gene9652-10670_t